VELEKRALWAAILLAALIGSIVGNWLIAIALPCAIYIAWTLHKLWELDLWISNGAKKGYSPEGGTWESIATKVLLRKADDKARNNKLSKRVKAYRDTVLALPDAAIVLNQNLEIEWANHPATHLLGVSKNDLGFRITNLIRQPKFVSHINAEKEQPLEIESPIHEDTILSVRVVSFGQDQKLLLARDISERIHSRHALQHFVANASHELKTPLTVTSGYIDLLKGDALLPEALHATVDQLRTQTDDMVELIEDLLTLSMMEGSSFETSEENEIDVSAMLLSILENTKRPNIKGDYTFVTHLNDQLKLLGLPTDIKSICTNLVENAIKHNPSGTTITITWQLNTDNQAHLSISDNGVGFDAESAELITHRFYRIPSKNDSKGSGLGLAIVKHGISQHGGTLEIHSSPNKGARFSVVFPLERSLI
jgi:two-component system phosphate regulon sensor histidine kinase PhoR